MSNIFEILGVEKRELSYSSFIAWIIDQDQKSFFLEKFFTLIEEERDKIISENIQFGELNILKERRKSNSIADIVIKGDSFTVVIENKVKSKEGEDQTLRLFEDWKKSDGNIIFLYLTPTYHEKSECDEFLHITYSQIKEILEEIDPSDFDIKTQIALKDFIEILEVYKMIKFEKFSQESLDYIKTIREIKEKEASWKKEAGQLFKEIETELKKRLSEEWNFNARSTNIEISKQSWKDIYYKCAFNISHLREGVLRIGIYCDNEMENREEKWKRFKKNYNGDRRLFSKAAWIKEGKKKYFNKLLDGGEGLESDLLDEIENLIQETENQIEEVINN